MKGDPKVIEFLNAALRSELTAVSQYWLHYRLQEDWGYGHLADKSRAESIEEMHHADRCGRTTVDRERALVRAAACGLDALGVARDGHGHGFGSLHPGPPGSSGPSLGPFRQALVMVT